MREYIKNKYSYTIKIIFTSMYYLPHKKSIKISKVKYYIKLALKQHFFQDRYILLCR